MTIRYTKYEAINEREDYLREWLYQQLVVYCTFGIHTVHTRNHNAFRVLSHGIIGPTSWTGTAITDIAFQASTGL